MFNTFDLLLGKNDLIIRVLVRLVHLDGSLVDVSMLKPSFSSINEEEIEERVDLEKEEDDVKQWEEEKVSESFSCSVTADPEPEQGAGRIRGYYI